MIKRLKIRESDSMAKINEDYPTMIITISSGISSDGCDIEIVEGNITLFKDSYNYGYNASHSRTYARFAHQDVVDAKKYGWGDGYIEKPYIGDIITDLCKEYGINKDDIVFKRGKNVFAGDNVSDSQVQNFINNHIKGVRESLYRLKEQDVEIEVKHTGILEVPEGKTVDELPIKHFVNLANKKGLSKITRALNNIQVWNKNKNPELSKWAGNMIDKVTSRIENQKQESIYRKRW